MYKVLVVGDDWHGSNCTGLARGFRALGHCVELVGFSSFQPQMGDGLTARVAIRLARANFVGNFNRAIIAAARSLKPDITLLFKGSFVDSTTLDELRQVTGWLVNFYPDISLFTQNGVAPQTWALYDHIFSTKTHSARELAEHGIATPVSHVQHGFDPQVHRPMGRGCVIDNLACDVSFIGGWSARKAAYLSTVHQMDNTTLRIWGGRWRRAAGTALDGYRDAEGIFGDSYALAVGQSKINLGLLHDDIASSGYADTVTSRSFHIPAAGGFLLHERNAEILTYYDEGKEIACFSDSDELADKIAYYLTHPEERERIARAGYQRCTANYSLTHRAVDILAVIEGKQPGLAERSTGD